MRYEYRNTHRYPVLYLGEHNVYQYNCTVHCSAVGSIGFFSLWEQNQSVMKPPRRTNSAELGRSRLGGGRKGQRSSGSAASPFVTRNRCGGVSAAHSPPLLPSVCPTVPGAVIPLSRTGGDIMASKTTHP